MPEPVLTDDALQTPSHYKGYVATIAKNADPNGPDVIATITCATIDADNEIVLPEGADLTRYRKNPVIMLCHAYGRPGEFYPLPVGKAIWIKQQGSALIAGIRFSRTSEMGREVLGLFTEGILAGFSIGFTSLEASPPTKEELRLHPEWAGVSLIHRRWLLLETSAVAIPSNPDALGAYVAKGGKLPAYITVPASQAKGKPLMAETTDDSALTDDTPPTDTADTADTETKAAADTAEPDAEKAKQFAGMKAGLLEQHAKVMHSGKAGHLYAHPDDFAAHYVWHEDDDDEARGFHSAHQIKAMLGTAPHVKEVHVKAEHPDDARGYERLHPPPEGYQATDTDSEEKALEEASGTQGGFTAVHTDSPLAKDPEPEPVEEAYTPEPGHVVKWPAHHGMHGGVGEVKSVHRKGKVPDTVNEATASDADPHARVELFRPKAAHMYERTGAHVGIHAKHLSRMPMMAGCESKSAEPTHAKKVVPYRAGPVSDEPWDADAAKKRIAKWASRDGSGDKDTIDWGKYEQAFTICDPERREDFGGFSLPHHDVKGGKLVVVKDGVRAALAALGGARGGMSVSSADKAGAEAHLHRHEAEWGGGEEGNGDDGSKSLGGLSRIPPFKTRSQVEARVRRQAMASVDIEAIKAQIEDDLTAKLIGAV